MPPASWATRALFLYDPRLVGDPVRRRVRLHALPVSGECLAVVGGVANHVVLQDHLISPGWRRKRMIAGREAAVDHLSHDRLLIGAGCRDRTGDQQFGRL